MEATMPTIVQVVPTIDKTRREHFCQLRIVDVVIEETESACQMLKFQPGFGSGEDATNGGDHPVAGVDFQFRNALSATWVHRVVLRSSNGSETSF